MSTSALDFLELVAEWQWARLTKAENLDYWRDRCAMHGGWLIAGVYMTANTATPE